MKKYILIVVVILLSFSVNAQLVPHLPVQGRGSLIQYEHFRAKKSLWIPYTNSTTPTTLQIDSVGSNAQVTSDGRFSVSKGLSSGRWIYLSSAELATLYQTIANLSTDLTASGVKYPSVNAVIAGLALKPNLATGNTYTGSNLFQENTAFGVGTASARVHIYDNGGSHIRMTRSGQTDRAILISNSDKLSIGTWLSPNQLVIDASGNVGIKATTPIHPLDVGGIIQATQFKVPTMNTAPASAIAPGIVGEIRITASYIYVCIATNTWVRSSLTTW